MSENQPEIYKDRDMLVVPIDGTSFPARCVKLNAPVPKADFKVVLDLLPVHNKNRANHAGRAAATMIGGKAGVAALEMGEMLVKKKRMEYHIGLSEGFQARRKKFLYGAIGLLLGAPVVAGILLAIVINIAEAAGRRPGAEAIPVAVLGVLMFIAGIVLFAIWNMGTLRIMFTDGKRIWLGGASQGYVDQFPELSEQMQV